MPIQTTYSQARTCLAELIDHATENRETVIIQRRGKEDVALIAVSELESLIETAHLLRSPKNAERLLNALARARAQSESPRTVDDLRREIGLI